MKKLFSNNKPYILLLFSFIASLFVLINPNQIFSSNIFRIISSIICLLGMIISTFWIIISEFKKSEIKDNLFMIGAYILIIVSIVYMLKADISSLFTLILTIIFDLVIKEYFTIKKYHDYSILSSSIPKDQIINKDYYELHNNSYFSTIKLFFYLNIVVLQLFSFIRKTIDNKKFSFHQALQDTILVFIISGFMWCLIVIFLFKSRDNNRLFELRSKRFYEGIPSNLCQYVGDYSDEETLCLRSNTKYKVDLRKVKERIRNLYINDYFDNNTPKAISTINEMLKINNNSESTDTYEKIIKELKRIQKNIEKKNIDEKEKLTENINKCISELENKKEHTKNVCTISR